MRRPSLPKLPRRGAKPPLSPQAAAAAKPRRKLPAPKLPALKLSLLKSSSLKPSSLKPSSLKPSALKLILPVAAAILVLVLLLGTCGSSDEQKVQDTLDRFVQASREKDYQTLCDELLSTSLVDKLRAADQPCEVVLRIGLSDVQSPTLEVQSVKLDGDRATAQVDTTAAGQQPFKTRILLVSEDGDWRVSALPDEQQADSSAP